MQTFKNTPLEPADFARPGPSGGSGPGQDKVKAALDAFCGLYDNADVDAVPRTLAENFAEVSVGQFRGRPQHQFSQIAWHGIAVQCRLLAFLLPRERR